MKKNPFLLQVFSHRPLPHLTWQFILTIFLSLVFASCQLFNNDVDDFMEKYTETAAIEEHEFKTENYEDSALNICIPSYADAEIEFLMRNPKQFNLVPSIVFTGLDSAISREGVQISQIDSESLTLKMPQKFLIPCDEGKDLTAEISLYEPMSGRTFDIYTVDMRCNTIPPLILNPTVINNNNSTFAIAFEMPNDEEMAIRHKDVTTIEIDGVPYAVEVTSETDAAGLPHAKYRFEDSRFTRTWNPNYYPINNKGFDANSNSVFFETGIPFTAQDKEFTLIMRDNAGLESTVKASTSISKLLKPTIKNKNGTVISEGVVTGIPFDETTKTGIVTICPPVQDHLGNPVSGATVHYRIYEATGSGIIYASGSTTEDLKIELPQNSYRIEAYATLINYENSATTTIKFRFVNNVLYINPDFEGGDGSEAAPWDTIQHAFDDINSRPTHETKFTIYIEGNTNEDMVIDGSLNTDELEITRKAGATAASVKSIKIGGTNQLSPNFTLSIANLKVSNPNGTGVFIDQNMTIPFDNVEISGCSHFGLHIKNGTVNYNGGKITGNSTSPNVAQYDGNTAVYIQNNSKCNFTGTPVDQNSVFGIVLEHSGECTLTNCTVSNNGASGFYLASENAVVNLTDTTVSGNSRGIDLVSEYGWTGGSGLGGKLNVSGNTIINNNITNGNKENVMLSANGNGSKVHIKGALSSTARIGITTVTPPSGSAFTAPFTDGWSTYNSGAPGDIFFSDKGYFVAAQSGEAVLSNSNGGTYTPFDYNITFTAENGAVFNTSLVPGTAKTITVEPHVTRQGTAIPVPDDLIWNLYVTCHDAEVVSSATNTITIPGNLVTNDVYILHINATYLGRLYDMTLRLGSPNPMAGLQGITVTHSVPNSFVFKNGRTIHIPVGTTFTKLIASDHETTQGEYSQYMIWYGDVVSNDLYRPTASRGLGANYPAYKLNWYEAIIYCNLRSLAEGLTPAYYLADASGTELGGTGNGRNPSSWLNTAVNGTNIARDSNSKYYYNGTSRSSRLEFMEDGSDTDGGIRFDTTANGWRLPTEAEWEWLARAGNTTNSGQKKYSGTNSDSDLTNYAWYSGNSNSNSVHEVKQKEPNDANLYDMSGNVDEWCWDLVDFASPSADTPETGFATGNRRPLRGGSIASDTSYCRVFERDHDNPMGRGSDDPTYGFYPRGFRVVRSSN